MSHAHAIVRMDAKETHVFHFGVDDVEKARIKSHSPFRKVHHKAGVIGAGHVHLDHRYFDEIAEALAGIQEWLLIGPGAAKTEIIVKAMTQGVYDEASISAMHPMNRMGTAQEIVNGIVWLLSDEASFVTGHILTSIIPSLSP